MRSIGSRRPPAAAGFCRGRAEGETPAGACGDFIPWLPSATCPFCVGLPGRTCHWCHGYRVLGDMGKVRDAAGYVWARNGCRCDACRVLRRLERERFGGGEAAAAEG